MSHPLTGHSRERHTGSPLPYGRAPRQTTSRFFSRGPEGSLSGSGLEVSHMKKPLAQYLSVVRRTVVQEEAGEVRARPCNARCSQRMPPARSRGASACTPQDSSACSRTRTASSTTRAVQTLVLGGRKQASRRLFSRREEVGEFCAHVARALHAHHERNESTHAAHERGACSQVGRF